METIFCRNREEWRIWLEKNHKNEREVWLIYMKKHTKKQSISYSEAVEEALCFGWIDSLVRSIDKESYMQKYTPRKANSVWSLVNKKRVEKLMKENKMTSSGLELVEIAKKNGQWDKAYSSKKNLEMPDNLMKALKSNPVAYKNFNHFPATAKNNYIAWVLAAKRNDTIDKRIKTVVERSEKNMKPGLI